MPQIENDKIEPGTRQLLDAKLAQADRLMKKLAIKQQQLKRDEARVQALRLEIGLEMVEAKLKRYVSDAGMSHVIVTRQREWFMNKLEDVLTRKEFETYCPHKAAVGALGKLIESLEQADNDEAKALLKKLQRCFEESYATQIALEDPAELKERKEKPTSETFGEKDIVPVLVEPKPEAQAKKSA